MGNPFRFIRGGLTVAGLLWTLLIAGCAGAPELQEPPADLPAAAVTAAASPATFYYPLETVTIAALTGSSLGDSLLVMRFDRPGSWSIAPERFLFQNGVPGTVVPIQTYGSSRLQKADIVILRTAPERQAGYREGSYGEEFFDSPREDADLPEAVVLMAVDGFPRPLILAAPEGSPLERRGIGSLNELRRYAPEQASGFPAAQERIIDDILRLGSASGSRRGFRSLLLVPSQSIALPDYSRGLELKLTFSVDALLAGDPSRALEVEFVPRRSAENPMPRVSLGDLGLFAGATPLLDPGLPQITADLYQSQVLVKIGTAGGLRPSPVLWEGSFNAYRDERHRFLFYPGIFSYIPGKHPDISPRDVEKVTGMSQAGIDASLRRRSLLTMRRDIYGGIPAFIAASPSPTQLEIAYRENPALRQALADFLREPAYFFLIDSAE